MLSLIIIFASINENLIEYYTGFSYLDETIGILLFSLTISKVIVERKIWLIREEINILILLIILYLMGSL